MNALTGYEMGRIFSFAKMDRTRRTGDETSPGSHVELSRAKCQKEKNNLLCKSSCTHSYPFKAR